MLLVGLIESAYRQAKDSEHKELQEGEWSISQSINNLDGSLFIQTKELIQKFLVDDKSDLSCHWGARRGTGLRCLKFHWHLRYIILAGPSASPPDFAPHDLPKLTE